MNSGIGTERAKELESLSVTARAADSDPASQVPPPRRVARLAVRVCLTVGLLYGCYLVARQGVATWHFRRGTAEEIRKAIRWDPGNAVYYAALARVLQGSPEEADVSEVIRLGETATRLSPGRAQYWAELGGSYEWAGREEEARRAHERAQELFPNSPDMNWKLGNFYVRDGRIPEALRAFRKTLAGDAGLRRATYDLAWRAEVDSRQILAEMIPSDAPNLVAYLNYLVETQRLDEAGEVWARLVGRGAPLKPQAAFPYLDALAQHARVDELRAVWGVVGQRRRGGISGRAFDSSLITNGSFESEILNGGLDWRVYPVEGVAVVVDSLTFFDGTRSLRIRFDGKHNLEYTQVWQYVPVEPRTTYRFVGYLRTERITTDMGPRFEIFDAHDASRLSVATEGVVGTVHWTPQQVEFKTGPDTRMVVVRLGRPRSRMFDNRISGTAWIDRLSLYAVQ